MHAAWDTFVSRFQVSEIVIAWPFTFLAFVGSLNLYFWPEDQEKGPFSELT